MSDLFDVAGGDAERIGVLRESLERLANGPNNLLKEMARSVLDGQVSLREAASSVVYGAEIGKAMRQFQESAEGRKAIAEATGNSGDRFDSDPTA